MSHSAHHGGQGCCSAPAPAGAIKVESQGGCHCGGHGHGAGELPELDVRDIPKQVRHPAILGALGSLEAGQGLVLVAPHNPLPLLNQVNDRWPGGFEIGYLSQEPESWRISLVRTGY